MKIDSWKPTAEATSEKEGLYVDDMVTFHSDEAEGIQRMQVVVALLIAMDFIATRRSFRIEDEDHKSWLSFDGERVTGPESLQMAIADMTGVVDVMRQRYFAARVEQAWRLGQEEAQARAEALAKQEQAQQSAEEAAPAEPEPTPEASS